MYIIGIRVVIVVIRAPRMCVEQEALLRDNFVLNWDYSTQR